MKKKDAFLKRYLELRDECEDIYGIKRPDPIAILVHYLYKYTEIKEPRAMKRLLEVPLDRVLDRLCKMGFVSLPEKPDKSLKPKLNGFVYDRQVPVFSNTDLKEKSEEEKLMDFVIS